MQSTASCHAVLRCPWLPAAPLRTVQGLPPRRASSPSRGAPPPALATPWLDPSWDAGSSCGGLDSVEAVPDGELRRLVFPAVAFSASHAVSDDGEAARGNEEGGSVGG